jgi:hypothetical protein
MAEKHYGHLAPSYVRDMVRATAPGLGAQDEPGTVVPLVRSIQARSDRSASSDRATSIATAE